MRSSPTYYFCWYSMLALMGRLKTVMKHTRNAELVMSEKTIKYTIPLYSERDSMGNFRAIEIKNDEICVYFETKSEAVEEVKATKSLEIEQKEVLIKFE